MKRLTAVLLCLVFAGGIFGKASAASMGVGAAEPAESEKITEEKKEEVPAEKEKAGVVSDEEISGKEETAEVKEAPAEKEETEGTEWLRGVPAASDYDAAAAYLKADSYLENDFPDAAEKTLEEITEKYPGSWWAEIACVKLSKMKLKAGKNEEGIKLLAEFVKKYTESLLLEKAKFNLCVAYVLNNDKASAAECLEDFIASYPESRNLDEAKKLLKKAKK